MIPTIGLMMGAYIVTRMSELLVGQARPHDVTRACAVVTCAIAIVGMVGLVITSLQIDLMQLPLQMQ